MLGGYPTETDMDDFFAEADIEFFDLGDPDWFVKQKQQLWSILNAVAWAMALGVHCPTPTTFNVRSGRYTFDGTAKTFTAGAAIDPTDNDTTYIWMADDNTIGYAVNGTGWPVGAHIKLAEIDIDVDGVITAVRDLRGQSFMNFNST
jgi:hypothetical protein